MLGPVMRAHVLLARMTLLTVSMALRALAPEYIPLGAELPHLLA